MNKRKMILLSIGLVSMLNACGSYPPQTNSILLGDVAYFGSPNVNSNLTFDPVGTFVYNEYSPARCYEAGTWVDLTPASTEGQVELNFTTDTCNTANASLSRTTQTLNYSFVQGNLFTSTIIQ